MGIGLAIVKRILDDHGFTVNVDSSEGEGTTFAVQIPPSSIAPETQLDSTHAL